MTDSACLTGNAAALNGADDIELTFGLGNAEGLSNDHFESFEAEIFIDVSAVDGNVTGTGDKTNASNGALSSAGAGEIGNSGLIVQIIDLLTLLQQR